MSHIARFYGTLALVLAASTRLRWWARPQRMAVAFTLLVSGCMVVSCAIPGSVKPTVKIGLSGPFEGLYRDHGYEVLHATRLAVQERNVDGGLGGRYLVELVALNDFNEPDESARQAAEMAADPGVLAVLGGWTAATKNLSSPEYERRGLVFRSPAFDPVLLGDEAARIATEELGSQRAVLLEGNREVDRSLGAAMAASFAALGGTVLFEGALAESLEMMGRLAPDTVFVAADAATASESVLALRRSGYHGYIIGGPQFGSRLVVQIAGDASDGVVFVSHLPPVQVADAWLEGYRDLAGGAQVGPEGAWAYLAAHGLLEYLEADLASVGMPDRQSVFERDRSWDNEVPSVFGYMIQDGEAFTSFPGGGTR